MDSKSCWTFCFSFSVFLVVYYYISQFSILFKFRTKIILGQGHGMHCQGYFNVRTFCARLVCHNGHARTERSIVLCLKYCENIKLYLNNNLIITLIILHKKRSN